MSHHSDKAATHLPNVGDLKITKLPTFHDENGALTVIESIKQMPYEMTRVFFVNGHAGLIRGQHAHKECQQFVVCTAGEADITCDDGRESRVFTLTSRDQGLLIPPGIWAQQLYKITGTVLTVFCNQPYNESDYIRDYQAFLTYRGVK